MMKLPWSRLTSVALVAVFALTAGCGPTVRAISGQIDSELTAIERNLATLYQYTKHDAEFGKGISEVVNRQGAAIEIIRADIAVLKRKAGIEGNNPAAARAELQMSVLPPTWAADVLNLAGLIPTARE